MVDIMIMKCPNNENKNRIIFARKKKANHYFFFYFQNSKDYQ